MAQGFEVQLSELSHCLPSLVCKLVACFDLPSRLLNPNSCISRIDLRLNSCRFRVRKSRVPMDRWMATGVAFFSVLLTNGVRAESFQSTSLDYRIVQLKEARSLANLCSQEPQIKECRFALGDWKPDELERVKLEVPACFDQCMPDVFGFYKDPEILREIPAVRTKDFDAAAPSRGFEVVFHPVALRLYRYEGCAGCSLIYQYPTKLTARISGQSFNLPILSRGGYYIPSGLRRAVIAAPTSRLSFQAITSEGEFIVSISSKALNEYVKMLRLLKYDQLN